MRGQKKKPKIDKATKLDSYNSSLISNPCCILLQQVYYCSLTTMYLFKSYEKSYNSFVYISPFTSSWISIKYQGKKHDLI